MAINVHMPGWRLRRELLTSGVSALAVVRGAQAGVRSFRSGHHGRRGLTAALTPLPVAWRFFPAVRLDGTTVAVVAGPTGVFLLETRQAGGPVAAHSTGLIVRGNRDVRTVAQARRRAESLSGLIGHRVRPIIVYTSGTVSGHTAGTTPVVAVDGLLGLLLSRSGAGLERGELVSVCAALSELARS